jgi:hypothetical protein
VAAAVAAAATAWRIEAKLNDPDAVVLPLLLLLLLPAAAFEVVPVLPPTAAGVAAGAFDAGSAVGAVPVAAGVVMMSWCICFAVFLSMGPASCSPAASQRPLAADPAPGMNCTHNTAQNMALLDKMCPTLWHST